MIIKSYTLLSYKKNKFRGFLVLALSADKHESGLAFSSLELGHAVYTHAVAAAAGHDQTGVPVLLRQQLIQCRVPQ